jgi:hypothetical protein
MQSSPGLAASGEDRGGWIDLALLLDNGSEIRFSR